MQTQMSEPIFHHPQSASYAEWLLALDVRLSNPAKRGLQKTPLFASHLQSLRWSGKTLLHVLRNLVAHMRLLLSETEFVVDYGLSFERDQTGRLVRHRRTEARICGTDNLRKTYPWAGLVEDSIFLQGFACGEAFVQSTLGKQESQPLGNLPQRSA